MRGTSKAAKHAHINLTERALVIKIPVIGDLEMYLKSTVRQRRLEQQIQRLTIYSVSKEAAAEKK